jgi:hypothetical protein
MIDIIILFNLLSDSKINKKYVAYPQVNFLLGIVLLRYKMTKKVKNSPLLVWKSHTDFNPAPPNFIIENIS